MKPILKATLLMTLILAAGCSSLTLPWSGSSVKADPTAEALFDEGNRAFNEKKYVRAIDSYAKIRSDHPFSPLVTQTELKMAEAYYFNEQYPEAINAYKEFQTLHPTNENIPLVVMRLGQSHFNQITGADRDQKNTEIAKGYFENVIANYPKAIYVTEAREKLAKCLGFLAEHEFTVAYFYFQQEKYPAARDRFEEVVRKYRDTPPAVKSLFYLGETYRNEKNAVRATLAYEALIQHYPQSKFAADARTQLATLEKQKHDPLAQLLIRDRRPGAAGAPEVKEDPALARLRNLNLVEKKEVVYEEPGAEKGFFSRVADKLNPFSSSGDSKKEPAKEESAEALLAKRKATQKDDSSGVLSALWPFDSKDSKPANKTAASNSKSSALVSQIDSTLDQKGIDSASRQAALKPPAADLPNSEPVNATPNTDTAALLSSIDSNLKRSGANPNAMPAPPEAAAGFREAEAQAAIARATPNQPPQDIQSSGILSSIDQKLRAQGLEPTQFDKPPTPEETKAAATAQKPQPKNVELEPKLALEKGPLFLGPTTGIPQPEKPAAVQETKKPNDRREDIESVNEPPNRVLVKGPVQAPGATGSTAKPVEGKKPGSPDEEPKNAFEQIRQDMDSVSKALNPFRW